MEMRTLGKTGLRVSALGFGAASLGTPAKEIDGATSRRTVREVLDLGINYIDVSPYYGKTRAETLVGQGLQGVPRDSYILATKAGRNDKADFNFTPEGLTASLEASLRRLNTDFIDVFQLHDIEFTSLNYIIESSIPALQKFKAEGKIRFYGVTGYPLKIFKEVLTHATVDTILSYCHYALNNTSLRELFPLCKEREVGIVNGSPLSMGLLTLRGAFPWHPASQEIKEACHQAALSCQANGYDLARLALQFATHCPAIPVTLVGSADPAEMKLNVAWCEEKPDLTLLEAVGKILESIRDKTWSSGLPENNL